MPYEIVPSSSRDQVLSLAREHAMRLAVQFAGLVLGWPVILATDPMPEDIEHWLEFVPQRGGTAAMLLHWQKESAEAKPAMRKFEPEDSLDQAMMERKDGEIVLLETGRSGHTGFAMAMSKRKGMALVNMDGMGIRTIGRAVIAARICLSQGFVDERPQAGGYIAAALEAMAYARDWHRHDGVASPLYRDELLFSPGTCSHLTPTPAPLEIVPAAISPETQNALSIMDITAEMTRANDGEPMAIVRIPDIAIRRLAINFDALSGRVAEGRGGSIGRIGRITECVRSADRHHVTISIIIFPGISLIEIRNAVCGYLRAIASNHRSLLNDTAGTNRADVDRPPPAPRGSASIPAS